MANALLIVDVQNDFCEGGALGVTGGIATARAIGEHVATHPYGHVVATRDYHIDPGAHFSDEPDYVRSWPVHCVAGTAGAGFCPELDVTPIEAVFSKGQYSDGYSGFEGALTPPGSAGSDGSDGTLLGTWLRERGVDEVFVCGIATDHCVRATALDAAAAGFTTTVLTALTAGVSPTTVATALEELRSAGVTVLE